MLQHLFQLGIEALYGQAHDVEVGTFDALYADVAYPLLYAVGTCLVHGAVVGDVVAYLVVGEGGEGDIATAHERALLVYGGEGDPSVYLVGAPAEATEHADGFGLIGWLAQHLLVEADDGVGRDDEFVGCHRLRVGIGLGTGDMRCYRTATQGGGV